MYLYACMYVYQFNNLWLIVTESQLRLIKNVKFIYKIVLYLCKNYIWFLQVVRICNDRLHTNLIKFQYLQLVPFFQLKCFQNVCGPSVAFHLNKTLIDYFNYTTNQVNKFLKSCDKLKHKCYVMARLFASNKSRYH